MENDDDDFTTVEMKDNDGGDGDDDENGDHGDIESLLECCLHIVVVGFDDKIGNAPEFCYPPFIPDQYDEDERFERINGFWFPRRWGHLPFLAISDGSHDSNSGECTFFQLDSLEEQQQTGRRRRHGPFVFGLAVYGKARTTPSSSAGNSSSSSSRGAVQKAVVLLMRRPVWGAALPRLASVCRLYFQAQQQQQEQEGERLLRDSLLALDRSLKDPRTVSPTDGLALRQLLRKFGVKTVSLLKLLMLERRVLFHSSPVRDLCSQLVTLASLFQLEQERLPALITSDSTAPAAPAADGGAADGGARPPVTGSAAAATVVEECDPETDEYGLPLRVFDRRRSLFLPFVCLHDLDMLMDSHQAWVAGTSNNLIVSRLENTADVLIDCNSGQIDVRNGDKQLSEAILPTASDLRWIRLLLAQVKETSNTEEGRTENNDVKNNQPLHQQQPVTSSTAPTTTTTTTTTAVDDDANPIIAAWTNSTIEEDSTNWIGSERYLRQQFQEYLQRFLVSVAAVRVDDDDESAISGGGGHQIEQVLVCTNENKNARRNPGAGKFYAVDLLGVASLPDFGLEFCRQFLETGCFAAWSQRVDPFIHDRTEVGHFFPGPATPAELLNSLKEKTKDVISGFLGPPSIKGSQWKLFGQPI